MPAEKKKERKEMSGKCDYCFTPAENQCSECDASLCAQHTDADGTCLDAEIERRHGTLKKHGKTKKEKESKMDNEKEPFDAKKPDAPGSGEVSDKETTEREARGEQEIPAEQAPSPAERTDKAGTPEEPLTGQPFDVDQPNEGSTETDPDAAKNPESEDDENGTD